MPETVKVKYHEIIDNDNETITIKGPGGRSWNVETTRYVST